MRKKKSMNKKIIGFILIIFNLSLMNAQDLKSSKVDELLQVTQVRETIPLMINSLVAKFKGQNTKIPDAYWEEIKGSIDYDSFINKTKKIYTDNYTIKELDELIAVYKSGDIETYKQKNERINSQVYQAGNEFGQIVVKQIATKIKAYSN